MHRKEPEGIRMICLSPIKRQKKREKGRTLESRWAQKLPFAFLLSEDLVKGAQTEWEL